MSRRYVAARLDGTLTEHSSLDALRRARRSATGDRVIVDHWPASDPPPPRGDAFAWNAWRLRRGVAS